MMRAHPNLVLMALCLFGCEQSLLREFPALLPASDEACTPPSAPVAVRLRASLDAVLVEWDASSDRGDTVDGYRVERVLGGGWSPLPDVGGASLAYLDEDSIERDATLQYRVRALRQGCLSEPSEGLVVHTLGHPPGALVGSWVGTPQLRWDDLNGLESGYLVERSREGGPVTAFALPAKSESFTDQELLLRAASFAYDVFALNADGLRSEAAHVVVATGPLPPAVVSAELTSTSATAARVSFQDTNEGRAAYAVERTDVQEELTVTLTSQASSPVVDAGPLRPEATYVYSVRAAYAQHRSLALQAILRTPHAPRLSWVGAPTLRDDCTLVVAGFARFDEANGAGFAASTATGEGIASALGSGSGVEATLAQVAPGAVRVDWVVEDSLGQTSQLARAVSLGAQLFSLTEAIVPTPTPARGLDVGVGRQSWFAANIARLGLDGCTRCDGTRASISLGATHACVLRADGTLACWGSLLGTEVASAPRPLCTLGLADTCAPGTAVTGTAMHTAGLTQHCVLSSAGQAGCFGGAAGTWLGNGTSVGQASPALVCASGSGATCEAGGVAGAVAMIATGSRHTCLLGENGRPQCFGENRDGQLGDGTQFERLNPTPVCGGGAGCALAASFGSVTTVALGRAFSCALRADFSVWCWGDNLAHQLGAFAGEQSLNPVRIDVETSFQVQAGAEHACVVAGFGRVLCWGRLGERVLTEPTAICVDDAEPCTQLQGAVALTGGSGHHCVLSSDGEVWCLGDNQYGQLGDGGRTARAHAARVSVAAPFTPLQGVVAISAAAESTCAVTEDGRVWCWGRNDSFQLTERADDADCDGAPCRLRPRPACLDDACSGELNDAALAYCLELDVSIAP